MITGNKDHPLYNTSKAFHNLMEVYVDPDVDKDILSKFLTLFVQIFHQTHNQFGFGQQDGHEYLTFLMRAIHDSMYIKGDIVLNGTATTHIDNLERKAIEAHRIDGSSTTELMLNGKRSNDSTCYDSVIFQLFSGQYRFQTQCRNPKCEHVSNRFETFRCCEVPISNPDKSKVHLSDVLTQYTSVVELDEKYECDKCKVRTNSYRRQTFWRLPEILVISLKRGIHHFDRDNNRYIEIKDNREVKIPDKLNMSNYCSAPRTKNKYMLYATGNHTGLTNGGHYYAHIKDSEGKWKIANDDNISDGSCPPEHICLLFYQLI